MLLHVIYAEVSFVINSRGVCEKAAGISGAHNTECYTLKHCSDEMCRKRSYGLLQFRVGVIISKAVLFSVLCKVLSCLICLGLCWSSATMFLRYFMHC